MSVPEEKFMLAAIELATENVKSGRGGPFGAVVVKNGEIIGRGMNLVTSTNDPTAHAEVVAIREACKKLGTFQLNDCEIYTSCEPCPMCLGAIYWARPKRMYYGNTKADAANIGFDDSFIYDEIKVPLHQRKIQSIQFLPELAIVSFKLWQESTNKIEY